MKVYSFLFAIICFLLLVGTIISVLKPPFKNGNRELPIHIRISLTVLLSGLALYLYIFNQNTYSLLLFFGMIMSTMGDLSMAKIISRKNYLFYGIAFFAIAHLFYLCSFEYNIYILTGKIFNRYHLILVVTLMIWFMFNYKINKNILKHKKISLRIFIAFYSSIISTMGTFAIILTLISSRVSWVLPFSSLLFIISDILILKYEISRKYVSNISLYIWITYIVAQLGIIFSSIYII